MNLHKHLLYLFEQHSESFKSWSAIIRIKTEGKSLIMKIGPRMFNNKCIQKLPCPVLNCKYSYLDYVLCKPYLKTNC